MFPRQTLNQAPRASSRAPAIRPPRQRAPRNLPTGPQLLNQPLPQEAASDESRG